MENPLVVFIDPANLDGARKPVFPIAWNSKGDRLDGVDAINGKECCMILLNDSLPVPACSHTNKVDGQTLPVVIHRNSVLHKRNQIEQNLSQWGKCNVVGEFSHTDKEATFLEVKALLANRIPASTFVKKFGDLALLNLLDQLATVCQIGIIAPSNKEIAFLNNDIFEQLGDSELRDQLSDKLEDWQATLPVVRARAATLKL